MHECMDPWHKGHAGTQEHRIAGNADHHELLLMVLIAAMLVFRAYSLWDAAVSQMS